MTLLEYLTELTGQSVSMSTSLRLTSGQRARLAIWAEQNNVLINREVIRRSSFSPAALIEAITDGEAITVPPAVSSDLAGPDAPRMAVHPGLGIDIQSVAEIIPEADGFKDSDELKGLFSLREISYAETRPDPRETLAGLYAAKEAIKKSDNRLMDRAYSEFEILPDEHGAPYFEGFSISISHSAGMAVACAIRAPIADQQKAGGASNLPTSDDTDGSLEVPAEKAAGNSVSKKRLVSYASLLIIGMAIPLAFEWLTGCSHLGLLGCP
ncbi:MAG: 4'-phosphopantetheinyl transferase superfamily protein [Pseudomonadota bacterium]